MPPLPTLSPTPPQKCTTTRGRLPRHIDPAHPPTKRKPIAALSHLKSCHHIDLLLPTELAETITENSPGAHPRHVDLPEPVRFAKVFLTLSTLLENPFFTRYVKSGSVAMRSEGRTGIDPVFALLGGVLALTLPAHVYQRTGLVGRAVELGGPRHQKRWYEVVVDLRAPGMLHGRRGFERVVWAARNVLDERRAWVFAEVPGGRREVDGGMEGLEGGMEGLEGGDGGEPIEALNPMWCEVEPVETVMEDVIVPSALTTGVWELAPPTVGSSKREALDHDEHGLLEEVLEYLALVAIVSPRVTVNDKVDPYICRYELPSGDGLDGQEAAGQGENVTRLRWKGFVPCQGFGVALITALKKVLEERAKDGGKDRDWAAIMMHGIDGEAVTLLLKDEGIGTETPASSAKAASMPPQRVSQQDGHPTHSPTATTDGEKHISPSNPEQVSSASEKTIKPKKNKTVKQSSIGFIEWSHQSCLPFLPI